MRNFINNYGGRKYLVPKRVDLLGEFRKDFDQVFNEMFGKDILNLNGSKKSKGFPLLDVIRSDEKLIFQYAVPGVKLEDLDVEITEDELGKILSVAGKLCSSYVSDESKDSSLYQIRELSSQEFRRALRIPEDVTEEEPEASLKDGILRLVFKTKQQEEVNKVEKKKINVMYES